MTSRNISIRDELYERLTRLKRKDQSYSDFIEELIDDGGKGSFSRLMRYFGILADIPDEFDAIIAKQRDEMNKGLRDRTQAHVTRSETSYDLP
jgi:predicted CopG family antitoxin